MTETTKGAAPHGVRYPWDTWFAKGSFTLVQGIDFQGLPSGMYRSVYQAAKKRGLKVKQKLGQAFIKVTVLEGKG